MTSGCKLGQPQITVMTDKCPLYLRVASNINTWIQVRRWMRMSSKAVSIYKQLLPTRYGGIKSHVRIVRQAREVELLVRDLQNIPLLLRIFLSVSRTVTYCDHGAFRHWALRVRGNRYELNTVRGYALWRNNSGGSDSFHWIVCAYGRTDRTDEEIHQHGQFVGLKYEQFS